MRWTRSATSMWPTTATIACSNTTPRLQTTPPPIWCSGRAATSLGHRRQRRSERGQLVLVPTAVALDASSNLYVADEGNSRVLEYDTPLTKDTTADTVFGQGGDFTLSTRNNGGVSASSLCFPLGLRWTPAVTSMSPTNSTTACSNTTLRSQRHHRRYRIRPGRQLHFEYRQQRRAERATAWPIRRGLRWTPAATFTWPTTQQSECSNTTPRFQPVPPPMWCWDSSTFPTMAET